VLGTRRKPQTTTIARDAELRADALASGDGGKVVVWSDGDTRFSGAISARGGAAGGNGGVAETSGKRNLAFDGTVDLDANGNADEHKGILPMQGIAERYDIVVDFGANGIKPGDKLYFVNVMEHDTGLGTKRKVPLADILSEKYKAVLVPAGGGTGRPEAAADGLSVGGHDPRKSRRRSISSIAPNCEPTKISSKPSCSTRLMRARASSGGQMKLTLASCASSADSGRSARSTEQLARTALVPPASR